MKSNLIGLWGKWSPERMEGLHFANGEVMYRYNKMKFYNGEICGQTHKSAEVYKYDFSIFLCNIFSSGIVSLSN